MTEEITPGSAVPCQLLKLCSIPFRIGNASPYFYPRLPRLASLCRIYWLGDLEPRQRSVVGTAASLLAVGWPASFLLGSLALFLFFLPSFQRVQHVCN